MSSKKIYLKYILGHKKDQSDANAKALQQLPPSGVNRHKTVSRNGQNEHVIFALQLPSTVSTKANHRQNQLLRHATAANIRLTTMSKQIGLQSTNESDILELAMFGPMSSRVPNGEL